MAEFNSYPEWVRATLAKARVDAQQSYIPMFDSHPKEPVELVHEIVRQGFGGALTDRYASAFIGGNPFVMQQLEKRYGVPRSHILSTTGASRAISLLIQGLTSAGDEVLVEKPGFDLFHLLATASGRTVTTFDRPTPSYSIDPATLDAQITSRTRLVILSNLHNPSGTLLSHDDLGAVAQVLERRQVHAVVDEVYLGYAPDNGQLPAASISSRFISVSSMTKIYSLSTLRCGWIVAEPGVIDQVQHLADSSEFGISNLAHSVAAMVLENDGPFLDYTTGVVNTALPVALRYLEQWREEGLVEGAPPRYGCVSFPRLVGIDDTEAFANWLARRCGVIVAPGEYFGAPGHVRLSHAKPLDLLTASFEKLGEGLRAYRAMSHEENGTSHEEPCQERLS